MSDLLDGAPDGDALPPAAAGQAAVLIDYASLHHYLKGRLDARRTDGPSALDLTAGLIAGLRDHLAAQGTPVTVARAYADFAALDERAQHDLYALGVEPVFVPGSVHRNGPDLQLAYDAAAALHAQPDVTAFALVSGDRDYVPVVQGLAAAGRHALVVGFKEPLAATVLAHTGAGHYVDGATLLPDGALVPEAEIGTPIEVTVFAETQDPAYEIDYDALEVIEKFFGQYDEIYLTPLLRRLSDEIGEVDDHDPKSLVADLEECGAARLERRRGMPYDYTVLIVNPEHPAVLEVREEVHGAAVRADADDGLPFEDAAEM